MKNSLYSFRSLLYGILISLPLTIGIQSFSFAQCSGVNVITSSSFQSSMWGSGFTNTTVYITSDFHIDNTFTISGCTIKIDPGVRIVVDAGNSLVITSGITNSHLSACTNMWDGITVESSLTLGVGNLTIINNTLIEDAEHAVFVPNSSSGFFRIQNTTFNKNWIHILIDHLPGFTYNTTTSSVSFSNFFCKDLSTGIYTTLLAPHTSARTFNAISYKSAGSGPVIPGFLTIGSTNVIENADIGVNNFNSHTEVVRSYIYDCDVAYSGEWDCTMKLFDSHIHDCIIGVESFNTMAYVEINRNEIYRISNEGIFIHNNPAEVIIYNNEIYEVLDAIVILDNNGNADIHANKIYNGLVSTFPNSHAVYVQQPLLYPGINLRITANEIAQYEQGIFISSFNKATVRGNYIDMDFIIPGLSYQIFAIKIENSDAFGVAVNTIKGNSVPNFCDANTCGVFIENCNEGGVICNNFGDPTFGNQFTFNKNLLMQGVVDMNFIGGNNFNFEHLWSLFILDSPDGLGVQGDPYYVTDNKWYLGSNAPVCGFTTQDIISENSHTSATAITEFNVRSGSPFLHSTPIILFSGNVANPNVVSASPMPDELCTFLRISNGNLESSIADGSAFNTNSSDAYKWFSQNWLYRAIPLYPMYSTPLFSSFYDNIDNGNYGALKNITNQIAASNTSNSTISTSSFVPSNSIEANIKTVLDIGAQIHNQGINSITITQKSDIDNMSMLCPQNDGPGVYMARAYRSMLNNQLYEYSPVCNGTGGANSKIRDNNQSNIHSAKLYFTNNELKINSSSNEIYNLEIIDMTGKIVYSTKVNSNTSKYLNLNTGIYLYLLTAEKSNANTLRGKLTIM